MNLPWTPFLEFSSVLETINGGGAGAFEGHPIFGVIIKPLEARSASPKRRAEMLVVPVHVGQFGRGNPKIAMIVPLNTGENQTAVRLRWLFGLSFVKVILDPYAFKRRGLRAEIQPQPGKQPDLQSPRIAGQAWERRRLQRAGKNATAVMAAIRGGSCTMPLLNPMETVHLPIKQWCGAGGSQVTSRVPLARGMNGEHCHTCPAIRARNRNRRT